MQIQDIKKNLTQGDYKMIAEMADCSKETVRSVLNQRRNAETQKGKMIIEVGIALIRSRENLKKSFKDVCNAE